MHLVKSLLWIRIGTGARFTCPVFAVAVQADGFDNAAQAMDAAFGANYNPWK